MKIAQIAPLYESVPPRKYGGTERIISYLTEELVKQGHEVTLFASGDSETAAKLVPSCATALRLDPLCQDKIAPHILQLDKVIAAKDQFDFMHFHTDYLYFPFQKTWSHPNLSTIHGRLDFPSIQETYKPFATIPFASISRHQMSYLPDANWRQTVYHGLPKDLYRFSPQAGKYLAFLGRVSPEKRLDRAIEIAIKAGMPLKVAAKVDAADEVYFRDQIKPLLDHPLVEFIGEISDTEKDEFLGQAACLLFPIDWPEPFGLVMVESLACGTPVIAYREGSVPEILEQDKTGFIVTSISEAVRAVQNLEKISRAYCREAFERRFSVEAMTMNYLEIYRKLIAGNRPKLTVKATG